MGGMGGMGGRKGGSGMMGGMMGGIAGGGLKRGGMGGGGMMGGMVGGGMMGGMPGGMMGRGMMGEGRMTEAEAKNQLKTLTRTDFLLQFVWKPLKQDELPKTEEEQKTKLDDVVAKMSEAQKNNPAVTMPKLEELQAVSLKKSEEVNTELQKALTAPGGAPGTPGFGPGAAGHVPGGGAGVPAPGGARPPAQ